MFKEVKDIFLDFNLILFYSTKGLFTNKGANVVTLDELIKLILNIDLSNPKVYLIIFILYYTNTYFRLVKPLFLYSTKPYLAVLLIEKNAFLSISLAENLYPTERSRILLVI